MDLQKAKAKFGKKLYQVRQKQGRERGGRKGKGGGRSCTGWGSLLTSGKKCERGRGGVTSA